METNDINTPLCVDLDGTLLKTDTLHELLFRAIKQQWWLLLALPFMVFKGKAAFKRYVASKAALNPALLPYNLELLAFLQQQKQQGRKLFLVTGCYADTANAIAEHCGIFEGVYATEDQVNLTGSDKAKLLCDTFGDKQFDYAGNASIDKKVWRHSRKNILVNCSLGLSKDLKQQFQFEHEFDTRSLSFKQLLKAIRLHQWAKNVLIFVPALTAHGLFNVDNLVTLLFAFLAFGLCASFNYIINDLLDLNADRKHSTKKHRPFASGTVDIQTGLLIGFILISSSLILALQLPARFLVLLALYFLITNLYSFYLKSIPILDVAILAGLYTLRVLVGAVAIQHEPSFWLIAFSSFLFFSLAIVKRLSELLNLQKIKEENASDKPVQARGYVEEDITTLQNLGSAAAIAAVLVLALYIDSPNVRELYQSPRQLWLLCPVMLVWLGRIWLVTGRGNMHEDPVVFAIKDKLSWLIFGSAALVMLSATFN